MRYTAHVRARSNRWSCRGTPRCRTAPKNHAPTRLESKAVSCSPPKEFRRPTGRGLVTPCEYRPPHRKPHPALHGPVFPAAAEPGNADHVIHSVLTLSGCPERNRHPALSFREIRGG